MTGPKKFVRVKEDFVCEHCGNTTIGNGYTNHCRHCLWSKHVDINPGDRSAGCGALMEPTAIETEGQETIITHTCTRCAHKKRNKVAPNDSIEAQVAVVKRQHST